MPIIQALLSKRFPDLSDYIGALHDIGPLARMAGRKAERFEAA